MSTEADTVNMNAMIEAHLTYCLTSWSQAISSTLTPLESLYKQTMDKKPNSFHHCNILEKSHLLSWENLIKYANICLIYKIIHGLAPPPLSSFVRWRVNPNQVTRGVTRGNCIIPLRKSAFSQSAFSIKAAHDWNAVPVHIRDITTYRSFSRQLRTWLISLQNLSALIWINPWPYKTDLLLKLLPYRSYMFYRLLLVPASLSLYF